MKWCMLMPRICEDISKRYPRGYQSNALAEGLHRTFRLANQFAIGMKSTLRSKVSEVERTFDDL